MKTNHVSSASQPPKRAAPGGRVVPALPLTMIRSKPARLQPKQHEVPGAVPAQELPAASLTNGTIKDTARAGHVKVTPNELEPQVKSMPAKTQSQGSAPMSLSDGTTPPQSASQLLSEFVIASPPSNADSTKQVASPPDVRHEPLGELDMRTLRSELPATAAQDLTRPIEKTSVPLPEAKVVFGARHHTSESLVPPLSAEGPSFLPPQMQPAPFFGHSHHFSEPQVPRGSHQGYPPMHWAPRPGFAPPPPPPQHPQHTPNGSTHLRHAHRDSFSTHGQNSGSVHRGRTDSYASGMEMQSPTAFDHHGDTGKPIFNEPKATFSVPLPQPMPHIHSLPAHPNGLPHGPAFESAEPLRSFLLAQFQNPLFSDCVVELAGTTEPVVTLDAHRLILARSPVLAAMMQATSEHDGKTRLRVQVNSPYFDARSFTNTIKYLYGGPLPNIDPYGHGPESPVDSLAAALNYVAAASLLKVDPVAYRAMDVIMNMVRWDTISVLLPFALHGGLSSIWDDGQEAYSDCSSDDPSPYEIGVPTYDPFATDILHRIVGFAVHNIPQTFYIDPSAPQLQSCPRLPPQSTTHERRSSHVNPRLSQIRFGQLLSDEKAVQRPSFEGTIISSILLSIPFVLLKSLLESDQLVHRLGPETAASVIRQVVHEREQRRLKALKLHTANNLTANGVQSPVTTNLYWEESVERSDHRLSGCRLTRKRVGVHTPTSSTGGS